MICTPGFVDIHPHFDSVQQLYEYQNAGFTTVIGGGSGPEDRGHRVPGVFNIQRMLEAMADIPLNFGNFGKGNAATPGSLVEQILAGRDGAQDPRGLVVLAGRHRDHHGACGRVRLPGPDPADTADRDPATTRTPSRPSTAGPCTSITAKARAGATRRT